MAAFNRCKARVEGVRSVMAVLVLLIPLPSVQAGDFSQAVQAAWYSPRAIEFAQRSAQLGPALQALCDAPPAQADAALAAARQQWLAGLLSWERLSAVALGPVLERRAQRQIDFSPTRPRMIEKSIRTAPKTPAAMELIGTPAKGFPALEWLLWVKPAQPGSPACGYAVQVAYEIQREAEALAAARISAADDQAFLSELVNQWVGGIERLRWAGMEMPVRVAMTSGQDVVPDFPRRDSGAGPVAWAAQWQALKSLATTGEASLQAALRQRGQGGVADALATAAAEADAVMQGLDGGDRARILSAARQLAGLKRLVEEHVAPALGVSIGFSDSDGD